MDTDISKRAWMTFVRLFLYAMTIVVLLMICSTTHGCGAEDETVPPVMVNAADDGGGGNTANDNNNSGTCPSEERATLYVESLYGGQVVCRSKETYFEEAVEVSGICMSGSGFSFVVYTEGPASLTASYEDGGPATLEFRVGTAPPELQSEVKLDWGSVVIVTVP